MTVAEVQELFRYNAWANRRIFAALHRVAAEPYFRDLKSSHGGVHGTLCHIVWAEELWLSRWRGTPAPAVAQGKDLTTLAAAEARWEAVDAERATFLAALDEAALQRTVMVQPSAGGAYRHTFREMFRHAIDHSSYHRGQVVTLLRQLDVEPPSTGLIGFYRSQGR
ncbi:MAG TPA: DinB family protein [Gemmatimonadales bacterium]|nr:DinB family protein [Gemmatimonadales bacterium]